MEELPSIVCERSKDLIELPPPSAQMTSSCEVTEFVKNLVDIDAETIEEEFKRSFSIGQRVQRIRPKKSLNKTKTIPPHRGKKRMTCVEKRKHDLLRLKKTNKTFQMFVPIHKMWREYARELVGYLISLPNIKDDDVKSSTMEGVKAKLKKMEFFGAVIKVTKSLCSEFIGLEGIVIRETKNTFSLITTEDTVKTVPKLHSEFSFIVENIGFSFLGNHLHQRPVDKAKQNFKKHCLWL